MTFRQILLALWRSFWRSKPPPPSVTAVTGKVLYTRGNVVVANVKQRNAFWQTYLQDDKTDV